MQQKKKQNSLNPFDWRAISARPIIGIDEVGRGCLAGPVCAAAVILDDSHSLLGLTDSKLLTESRREQLASQIQEFSLFGIGTADVAEVDEMNILQASFLAMKRALMELVSKEPSLQTGGQVLVDGHLRIPGLDMKWKQQTLIKGDLIAEPISAASIVAKVYRDHLMREWHEEFPQYGFAGNKGYGSESHREVIQSQGPCWLHRKSFAGVREHWRERQDIERERVLGRKSSGRGSAAKVSRKNPQEKFPGFWS